MLRRRRPGPPLCEFVEALWTFDGFVQAHEKERIMPDGALALVVNLHEDRTRIYDPRDFNRCQTLNGCLAVGTQSEFFVIDTAEQLRVAGVQFRPGGAFPFLGMPAGELHGLHVELDALWGGCARELRDRLLEAGTGEAAFDVMEEALLARARGRLERHPAVGYGLGRFLARPEMASIGRVTAETGISPRRFIELFRREAGLTPKLFCRLQRFQRALARASLGERVEWTDVALEAGYFDQAHFIHDFRAFSGINPSAYRAANPRHPNHVPILE
jgi:AraC-like DNA-binding protein